MARRAATGGEGCTIAPEVVRRRSAARQRRDRRSTVGRRPKAVRRSRRRPSAARQRPEDATPPLRRMTAPPSWDAIVALKPRGATALPPDGAAFLGCRAAARALPLRKAAHSLAMPPPPSLCAPFAKDEEEREMGWLGLKRLRVFWPV